jgi:hypothetical protein
MKRQMMKAVLILGSLTLGNLALPGAISIASAGTQLSVNVNIGPPPPVIVQAPPTMVYLAEPGVYAAVGVPYDIFFFSGRYYYVRGNDWFWGAGYNGPWTFVEYRTLPPGLQKYKVERLRVYRENEYVVYKQQGPKFQGKHFEAEGHGPGNSQGNSSPGNSSQGNSNPGNGRGNSGNGKKGK